MQLTLYFCISIVLFTAVTSTINNTYLNILNNNEPFKKYDKKATKSVTIFGNENLAEVKDTDREEILINEEVTTFAGASFEETHIDIVQTTHGPVRGYLLHEELDILSYIDIPYGRIDKLFQAPLETVPWQEIHQVSSHSSICPQLDANDDIIGQLDCLTLSIFAPKNTVDASVIFHVHDGNFEEGSGDPNYYGPEYLVSKGIILVLPNYRLGPLGFLCLQDHTAPGNAGLKDLSLALTWTVTNIKNFGGNPEKITVSGEGTAGALVGHLTLSSQTNRLISQAIIESGSLLAHWALDRNPIDAGHQLINSFPKDDPENVVVFSHRNLTEILTASKGIKFRPCIENGPQAFLNQTPWSILTKKSLNTKFIIGVASLAGSHDVVKHDKDSVESLNDDIKQLLPEDLSFINARSKDEVATKVKCQYFGVGDLNIEEMERLSMYYTDMSYLSPSIRAARLLVSAGATVYFYEFSFHGAFNREAMSMPFEVQGAARGDVVGYLFVQDNEYPEEGTAEYQMMNVMTDLWTSFINDGQPSSEGISWTHLHESSEDEESWLSIGPEVKAEAGVHVDRLKLWTEIYKDHFVENRGYSIRISNITITLAVFLIIFKAKLN